MRIIENANLPCSRVKLAAISSKAGEAIKKLSSLGTEALKIEPLFNLSAGINSHADLRIFQLKNKLYLTKSEHSFCSRLKEYYNIIELPLSLAKDYPLDVPLNVAVVGKHIILNPKTASSKIMEEVEKSGFTIIPVNQGYSKCSVAVLNENSIITDDEGICKTAGKFLNDVTLISKGSVQLNGYNYGFIGGCCGKISENEIAFNGDIESHDCFKEIEAALCRNNIKAVSLKEGKLEDIGGIIPLLQL